MPSINKHISLQSELEELRTQLQEANETIHAIRTGQIDALMVTTETGPQLYTLKSADHTYRVFTISEIVGFCNFTCQLI